MSQSLKIYITGDFFILLWDLKQIHKKYAVCKRLTCVKALPPRIEECHSSGILGWKFLLFQTATEVNSSAWKEQRVSSAFRIQLGFAPAEQRRLGWAWGYQKYERGAPAAGTQGSMVAMGVFSA